MVAITRFLERALLCAVAALAPAATEAQPSTPPAFSNAFSSGEIGPGSASTLVFTVDSSALAVPVTGLAFTHVLPTGLDIADGIAATSCPEATLSAPAGGDTISFADGKLGAGQTCTVSVDVTAATQGTYTSPAANLSTNLGTTSSQAISLDVVTSRPGFRKAFSPTTVSLGGTSTLTFTIDNSLNGLPVGRLDFTDILPAGVVVASPSNASTDCISASNPSTVLTSVPGSGSITLDADGLNFTGYEVLPAGSTCTVSVDVAGAAVGTFVNTTGLQADAAPAGKATASLTVTGAVPGTLNFTKEFIDDPVFPGASVTLEYRITNLDRSNEATSVAFDDDLTSLPALAGLTGSPRVGCDSGGRLTLGAAISLDGATIPPGGTCTFRVFIGLSGSAAPGSYTSTSGAVTAIIDGVAVTGSQASNTLTVVPQPALLPPVVSRVFLDSPILPGDRTRVRYTVSNPNTGDALSGIGFADNLADIFGGAGFAAAVLSDGTLIPQAGVTEASCGGLNYNDANRGFPPTFPNLASAAMTFAGGALAAGASCSFTVHFDVGSALGNGVYAPSVTDVVADGGLVGSDAASSFTWGAGRTGLRFAKAFQQAGAVLGDVVNVDFTFDNSEQAVSGLAFSDDLENDFLAGATYVSTVADGCGFDAITGTSVVVFSGGEVASASDCTTTIAVQLPASGAPGSYTNTTSNLTAAIGGTGAVELLNTAASASIALTAPNGRPLVLTKAFADPVLIPGQMTALNFTLTNPNPLGDAGGDASGVAFSDNLADMLPGTPDILITGQPAVAPCGGSQFVTGSLYILSGASVASGESCSFSIIVEVPLGAKDGTYVNRTSRLSGSIAGSGAFTSDPATASLTVQGSLIQLTKSFPDNPVAPGARARMRLELTNLSATERVTNIAFADDLAAMLPGATLNSVVPASCPFAVSGVSGALAEVNLAELFPGQSCSIDLFVDIPAGAAEGTYTNTTSAVTGTTGLAVYGPAASATLQVSTVGTQFSKSFAGPVGAGGTATLTFTITNPNAGTVSGLSFTDDLDAMLSGAVATRLPTDPCGAGSSISGTGLLAFSGGELAGSGGTCSFDVEIAVPATAPAGLHPNTTSELTASGLFSAAPATASLQVEPPPVFSKAFERSASGLGQTTALVFTIDNTASVLDAGSIAFTDVLPAGLRVASPPDQFQDIACSGSSTLDPFTAVAGSTTISANGGSVAAGDSCDIRVNVTATAIGTHVNTTGDLTSTLGNSGTATDTMTVVPQPVLSEVGYQTSLLAGQGGYVYFGIDNTGSSLDATSASFTNDFPPGFELASPLYAYAQCDNSGTIPGLSASVGDTSITLSGFTIPAGDSCQIFYRWFGANPGTFTNTGTLTSSLGDSGSASRTYTVYPLPTFTKAFAADTIALGQTTTLTFTIDNTGSPIGNSVFTFTDVLPAGIEVAATPNASTDCTDAIVTATAGGGSIDVTDGLIPVSARCAVSVDVTGTAVGTHVNTSGDLTFAGVNAGNATDRLTVVPQPVFTVGGPTAWPVDVPFLLQYFIENRNSTLDAASAGFAQTLPAGLEVAPGAATAECRDRIGAPLPPIPSITASAGDTSFSYSGVTVPAGAFCALNLPVVATTTGTKTVTTGDFTSSLGNSGPDSATIEIQPRPSFSKAFGPDTIALGQTSTLTFTIDNTASSLVVDGLSFTDDLPAGMEVAAAPNAATTCTGGALTATAGGGSISYAAGEVGDSASCTVSVDVTATATGALVNTSGDLTSRVGNSGPASATLTVVPLPGFTKDFAPDPILLGDSATLTFTIDNTGSILAATALDFTDDLPAGMVLATPPAASTDCTGGTVTATAGGGSISYAGGSVAAGASCTLTVNVTPTASGDLVNTSGDLTSSLGNSGPASDTLTVDTPEIEVSGDIGGAVAVAGTLPQGNQDAGVEQTLTLTVTNTGTAPLSLAAAAVVSAQTNVSTGPLTGPLSTLLAVNESTTITVPYTPTAAGGFSFDISLGNDDVDENPYAFTVSGTALDVTAPAGYTATLDRDLYNLSTRASASFTFAAGETGATYDFEITSDGGPGSVTGTGTLATATDQVTGIDLTPLPDGTLTLSVTLTDAALNTGLPATDTADLDATPPAAFAVAYTETVVNLANQTAIGFGFAGAEVGATFAFRIDSITAPGAPVSGTGTITDAAQQVTGIDLSGLPDDPAGLRLLVSLIDPAGNPFGFPSDSIVKDTVAPSAHAATFDQDPVNAANAAAMSFSFTGGEPGAAFAFTITSDGGGTPVTGTGTLATGTDSVSGLDLSGLGDGTLTLTARLTDPAGNAGADSIDTATKDVAAPGAAFDTPVAGDGIVNAAEAALVTVSGTASGVLDGATVTVAVSDGVISVAGPATVAGGAWSLALDLSGLADGPLTLTADVQDAAGNPAPQATAAAIKDTLPPALTIDTPIAGDGVANAAEMAAVTISGTAADLPDGSLVTVVLADGAAGSVTARPTVSGGTWSTTLDLSGLAEGPLSVSADASDAAGNPAPQATASATKESTAPSGYGVAFDQDPVNLSNQSAASFTFAGAEPGAAYAFAIASDGGGTPVTGTGTVATATEQVGGLDLSGLGDGTLTLTVALTDPAGNTGADAADTAAKDSSAPSGYGVAFDQDPVNLSNQSAASFSFAGAEPGAAYAFAIASDGGGTPVTGTGTVATATEQVGGLDLSGLGDGTLTLTVALTDPAGNTGADAVATTSKDTTAPTLAFDAPLAGDDVVNAAEAAALILSGTATGLADGSLVTLAVSDGGAATPVTVTATVTAGSWRASADVTGLSDGVLAVTADAADAAGNPAAQALAALTLDTTLPVLTVDAPIAGDDIVNAAEAGAVTISGTATDLPDGSQLTLTLVDSASGVRIATPVVTGGAWSLTLDFTGFAEGALSLAADARDAAGNPAARARATAAKDTTAPKGYGVAFDRDPVNLANQSAASFTFAGAEPGAAYAFAIASDGGGTPVTGTGTVLSATEQVGGLDLSGLGDGRLTLTVVLTDPAGNTGAVAAASAAKDTITPTATLAGPFVPQSGGFTVTVTFSEPVPGMDLTRVAIDNGKASALTGGGTIYGFTVTPDHDGPIEIALLAGAASDGNGNPSEAAGPLLAIAHLTGVPNPNPLPDADGDGIPDALESAFEDHDGDGIPDIEDFDPQGYFYCEDDGRIIPGGSFSVSGPLGTNSGLGIANGINITRDGSTGEIQWFALVPGTFTMTLTYPTTVGLPSTARLSSGTLDMTTLLPANPASLGSSEVGGTGVLADASLAANPVFHTSFTIEPGDPFVVSNNIPMTQCAENPVNITASTDGAEANGGTPADVTFAVTQDRVSTQDTVIGVSLGGSAVAGADVTAPARVTIAAGETSAVLTVPVLEDGEIEGPETVTLTLTSIDAGDLSTRLGSTLTASATILDDDFADIAVTNVDLVTNEGGDDDATMTFVLLGVPSAPVTLSFAGDSQCSVSPAVMTFTAADYGRPQALTIRARNDDKDEGTHSCQPVVAVASADARFDALPLALAAVTITDDLVDQIREPLTEILEEDLKDTIETQQRAFSRIAKGALRRLQDGADQPCGTLKAFDVDGSLEIKDATGTAQGTFGSDVYNCATNTREIVDGSFTLNKTGDTGLQALLQVAFQREKFVTDREIAGYFVGGYVSRTDVSGPGEGEIAGFGMNGGLYGARGLSGALFLDYYLAGAAGRHRFDIDFDAAPAEINARGSYGYLAGFAGVGLSGQQAFDSFVMKPRVALDLAYARAGDADVTARQLGLTHTGVIELDDFSGMRATAEVTFESLAAPGGSEALAARMRTAITPRLTCTLNSYDSEARCGVGLALAWDYENAASGLGFGIEVDVEQIDDDRSLTLNLTRERPIWNGSGAVVTRLSMPQARTWQVEHGVKVDF